MKPSKNLPGAAHLGELLRAEVELRNLTQPQAAREIGISVNTLLRILNRQSKATSPVARLTWDRISRWLGVTAESLRRHCCAAEKGDAPVALVSR